MKPKGRMIFRSSALEKYDEFQVLIKFYHGCFIGRIFDMGVHYMGDAEVHKIGKNVRRQNLTS